MTPEDQSPEPLEILHRREKRLFWWTCGWVGAGVLGCAVGRASEWSIQQRMSVLSAAGQDVRKLRVERMISAEYAGLFTALCMFGLLICLMRWVGAIQRRRKISAGVFER